LARSGCWESQVAQQQTLGKMHNITSSQV
jgi:hypothetical protein